MDRKKILCFINKIIKEELNINYGPFSEEKTMEYIGLDSLGLMTLIVYLEETIQCRVDLENILLLNNTITIANIIDNVIFEN